MMPEAEYRAHEAVSYHDAVDFLKSPWLFYQNKVMGRKRPERDYHIFGQAQHALTLEGPEALAARFCFPPEEFITEGGAVSKSKAAKAWAAEQGDKKILSPNDYTLVATLAAKTWKNPHAARLLKGASVEVVKFATVGGLDIKGRADGVTTGLEGFDLKGCADLDNVPADITSYHYVDQLAWYEMLFRIPFRTLIFQEKSDPYRCGVWVVGERDIDAAKARMASLMASIVEAKATDSWPCDPLEIQTYAAV